MAAMSDYLEQQLLDHVFRSTTYTPPANLVIALCTSVPTSSDTGALPEEVTAADYTRISVGRGDAVWSAISGGTTVNSASIIWPAAQNDWGTIQGVAILDDATIGTGNLLFYGAIANPQAMPVGAVFQFNPTQLGINFK